MFDAIRVNKSVTEKDCKFYAACLILVLEYLQERNIVHRDLKPENIMIDHCGYPKIIDFGVATIAKDRTYTLVGTPHYMAPEIISGAGYGPAADVWSLGVILCECLYGCLPFGDELEDPALVYKSILECKLKLPHGKSSRAKKFVESVLDPVEDNRDLKRMKVNSWMTDVDWKGLLAKRVKAGYLPEDVNTKLE